MRFTAKTDNGTNITVIGEKNSEVQNNIMTYNVTFIFLQSNDEPNMFYKNFIFYDSEPENGIEQIDVYPEDLHIRNENWAKIKEIKFPEKPKEVSNGLYFDFDNPNEFKDYTFERNADAYMSYIPLNEKFREEIKCTFKNNTDSYNLVCHPEKSFITYMNTLRMSIEGIRKSRRLSDPKARPYILHRIDKDTSGVLVFAKDIKLHSMLKMHWNEDIKLRKYIAVVSGRMPQKEDRIISYLKENVNNLVYVSEDRGGKKAVTNYKVLKENARYSMLDVAIETGRKNQIRVQLESLGHPVIGDEKYGEGENPIGRLGLHASELIFIHPVTKQKISLIAPVPKEFNKLF